MCQLQRARVELGDGPTHWRLCNIIKRTKTAPKITMSDIAKFIPVQQRNESQQLLPNILLINSVGSILSDSLLFQ